METIIETLKKEHEDALLNSVGDWEKKYNKAVEQHQKELENLRKKLEEEYAKKSKDFESEKKALLEQME